MIHIYEQYMVQIKKRMILTLLVCIFILPRISFSDDLWNKYNYLQNYSSFTFDNEYVWCASDAFLTRLDKRSGTIVNYQYPFYIPNSSDNLIIETDSNGSVWIAAEKNNSPYDTLMLLKSDKLIDFDDADQLHEISSVPILVE